MTSSLIKRAVVCAGIAALSISLAERPAFADDDDDDDDDDRGRNVKTVRVDCAYTTISEALKRHRKKALVIIVKGTCHEDVFIDRDGVTHSATISTDCDAR